MEVVSTMEDRKARIAALRAKAGRAKLPPPTTDSHPPPPVLQIVAALVNMNNNAPPPPQKKPKGGQEKKKQQESILDKALRQAQAEAKTAPSSAAMEDLAPKKINADLKREIQPKLTKLERRTQKAIVALLRERLEQEASVEIDD